MSLIKLFCPIIYNNLWIMQYYSYWTGLVLDCTLWVLIFFPITAKYSPTEICMTTTGQPRQAYLSNTTTQRWPACCWPSPAPFPCPRRLPACNGPTSLGFDSREGQIVASSKPGCLSLLYRSSKWLGQDSPLSALGQSGGDCCTGARRGALAPSCAK